MINLLITGGTGCAGTGVLNYLNYIDGYNIYSLTRKKGLNSSGKVKYVYGDLKDKESLRKAFDDYEITAVWHMAGAVDPYMPKESFYDVNVSGTKNLLEVSIEKGVDLFNYTSSVSVYGINLSTPVKEDHDLKPLGHYAKSKLLAEEVVLELAEENDIKGGILRLPLILGKKDRHFYPRISKLLKWNLLPIMGDKKHKISIVHPYDIAQALDLLTKIKPKMNIYNLKTLDITFKDLIAEIEKIVRGKARWRMSLPYPLLYLAAFLFEIGSKIFAPSKEPLFNREYAAMMGREWTFDIAKIEKIGYRPTLKIETILKDLITEEEIPPVIVKELKAII